MAKIDSPVLEAVERPLTESEFEIMAQYMAVNLAHLFYWERGVPTRITTRDKIRLLESNLKALRDYMGLGICNG